MSYHRGLFLIGLAFAFASISVTAQQHVARQLGNPATRFAAPLHTTEDLRRTLGAEALKNDVAAILVQHESWQGDVNDFLRAVATEPIYALRVPTGTRLPAMSSRKQGRPVLLHDVLWSGTKPFDAYEFFFASRGERYRCVVPKPCCNFWVEHLGPESREAILTLSCDVPEEVSVRRTFPVCLTVRNIGNAPEPSVTVRLPIPAGAAFTSSSGETNAAEGTVIWRFNEFAPGTGRQICATFTAGTAGELPFSATVLGTATNLATTACTTRITGVPGVLFEVIDRRDPIMVGSEQVYEISVLNQGSTVLRNVAVVCTLEESQQFISGSGASAVEAEGGTVRIAPVPKLAPKESARWEITVKALAAGDVRLTAELTSDHFQRPIRETEATQQY